MKFDKRAVCPLCKSSHLNRLLSYPLNSPLMCEYLGSYYGGAIPLDQIADNTYSIALCLECGFMWQEEILDDDGMNALYETWIGAESSLIKKQHEDIHARVAYSSQCIQVSKALRREPYDIHVLDFGSGWGNWLLIARAMGFQSDGLELSPSRIAYTQSLGLRTVHPAEIQPATYAFINAEQVFEHLSDPVAIIQQCHGWLAKGGLLRISVPNGRLVQQRIASKEWSMKSMPTRPLEHINVFTPATLQRLGQTNGFRLFVPPIVLPQLGMSFSDLRWFGRSLARQLLNHVGMLPSTTVWLIKT